MEFRKIVKTTLCTRQQKRHRYKEQTFGPCGRRGWDNWEIRFDINTLLKKKQGFPHSSVGKESACNAGDQSSILGSGRSPGEGNGNPLQYSCLENSMDRGAWQATVHWVARVGHNLATKERNK